MGTTISWGYPLKSRKRLILIPNISDTIEKDTVVKGLGAELDDDFQKILGYGCYRGIVSHEILQDNIYRDAILKNADYILFVNAIKWRDHTIDWIMPDTLSIRLKLFDVRKNEVIAERTQTESEKYSNDRTPSYLTRSIATASLKSILCRIY